MSTEIIGFIPCKLDSKRLIRKNLSKINGKTLLQISIDYLLASRMINNVYVSTESHNVDELIKLYSSEFVHVIGRPNNDPDMWLAHLYHTCDQAGLLGDYEYLVATTPDCPIKPLDLDAILENIIKIGIREFFTHCPDSGLRTGALNIFHQTVIERMECSSVTQTMPSQNVDIHTEAGRQYAEDELRYLMPSHKSPAQKLIDDDIKEFGGTAI